jgi:hypothetical protein
VPPVSTKVVRNDMDSVGSVVVSDHFLKREIHYGHFAPREMAPKAASTARARP